jgi:hypothetical protein
MDGLVLQDFFVPTEWRAIICGLSSPVTVSQLKSRLTPSAVVKGSVATDAVRAATDLLLTMAFLRQLVATHGNRFGLISRFSLLPHLPPVATACDRSAP